MEIVHIKRINNCGDTFGMGEDWIARTVGCLVLPGTNTLNGTSAHFNDMYYSVLLSYRAGKPSSFTPSLLSLQQPGLLPY